MKNVLRIAFLIASIAGMCSCTRDKLAIVKEAYEKAQKAQGSAEWEICLAELAKIHKITPNFENSKSMETFCKSSIAQDAKCKTAKADPGRAQKQLQRAEALVQANQHCKKDSECIVITPRNSGGYRFIHWAINKSSSHLAEIQNFADDIFFRTQCDGRFTSEAKIYSPKCLKNVCQEGS